MTTYSYTSLIDHTTDAGYRAWGLQLSNAMQSAGLVKTADTGQIDWSTITRPAINTTNGYEIFRFNDSLQSARPIFIRFDYGSGNPQSNVRIQITIGTGTNGAGTITGSMYPLTGICRGTAGPYLSAPTYVCHNNGYFLLLLGAGAFPSLGALGFFLIDRSRDDFGALVQEGWYLINGTLNVGAQGWGAVWQYGASILRPAGQGGPDGYGCFIPSLAANSGAAGGGFGIYRHYGCYPRMRAQQGCFSYFTAELPLLTPVSATVSGSSPRTYLPTGTLTGPQSTVNLATGVGMAVLWE